jgi:hypothetical protein
VFVWRGDGGYGDDGYGVVMVVGVLVGKGWLKGVI